MAELRRKRTAAAAPSVEPLTPLRYASLADILRRSPSGGLVVPALAPRALSPGPVGIYEDDDVVCDGCGSGDREEQLLLCDRCGRGRHTFCLRPVSVEIPDGAWFCDDCAPPPPAAVPVVKRILKQTKIIDFFKIKKKDGQDGEQSQGVGQVLISTDNKALTMADHIQSAPTRRWRTKRAFRGLNS